MRMLPSRSCMTWLQRLDMCSPESPSKRAASRLIRLLRSACYLKTARYLNSQLIAGGHSAAAMMGNDISSLSEIMQLNTKKNYLTLSQQDQKV